MCSRCSGFAEGFSAGLVAVFSSALLVSVSSSLYYEQAAGRVIQTSQCQETNAPLAVTVTSGLTKTDQLYVVWIFIELICNNTTSTFTQVLQSESNLHYIYFIYFSYMRICKYWTWGCKSEHTTVRLQGERLQHVQQQHTKSHINAGLLSVLEYFLYCGITAFTAWMSPPAVRCHYSFLLLSYLFWK